MSRKLKARYTIETFTPEEEQTDRQYNLYTKFTDLVKNTTTFEAWRVTRERCATGALLMWGAGNFLSARVTKARPDARPRVIENVRSILQALHESPDKKLTLTTNCEIIA